MVQNHTRMGVSVCVCVCFAFSFSGGCKLGQFLSKQVRLNRILSLLPWSYRQYEKTVWSRIGVLSWEREWRFCPSGTVGDVRVGGQCCWYLGVQALDILQCPEYSPAKNRLARNISCATDENIGVEIVRRYSLLDSQWCVITMI